LCEVVVVVVEVVEKGHAKSQAADFMLSGCWVAFSV